MDDALLRALSDGQFHSGEALGAAMGLSRAAIWKRLQALEAMGLDVQSVRGKGYRIAGGMELLDERQLRKGLPGESALPLDIRLTTVSTNQDALSALAENRAAPFAVLSEHQSGGRGRRGRDWVSPLGRNLFVSLAWPFNTGAAGLEGLSLATGVAVADALAGVGLADRVQLKWPNDIWLGGRKVGGILTELAGDMDSACIAVIGVGVNVHLPARLAAGIDQPWTDLASECATPVSRNALAASVLARLVEACDAFARLGFAAFHSRWKDYDALVGRPVVLTAGDVRHRGTCLGVSARGALLLDGDDGERAFHGGEASLRADPESAP